MKTLHCRAWKAAALAAFVAALPGLAAAESAPAPKPFSQEWVNDPPPVEDECVPANDRYALAPLFRIVPEKRGERVYLLTKKQACVGGGRCPQRQRSYLVFGDIVLGGPEDRGFRCVYFGTQRGVLVTGFVPVQALARATAETTITAAWLAGEWRRDEASHIRVTAAGGNKLRFVGDGYWQGMQSRNIGGFVAVADVAPGPTLVVREDDSCAVVFERRGPYLLVNDNARCGGHNVRFAGIYFRRTAR